MSLEKETEYSLAQIPFRNHTALLLGIALPYLTPAFRHPVELALKFLEFSETLRLYREFHLCAKSESFSCKTPTSSPNATGFFGLLNTYITDLEGLLTNLSGVCTGDGRELIQMFLNLIRVKNFYETYGDLLQSAGAGMADFGSLFSTIQGTPANTMNNDQTETLELLKSLFSNEI